MLLDNSYLLIKTEVLGIKNILRDNSLPSYPLCLYCISEDQSTRNSKICIYPINQLNTRLYSTVKEANMIDLFQDELIPAINAVIDTSEGIDSQRFGLVVQSIVTPNGRNCIHIVLDNGKVSHKRLPIYFTSYLDCINIISISYLF